MRRMLVQSSIRLAKKGTRGARKKEGVVDEMALRKVQKRRVSTIFLAIYS